MIRRYLSVCLLLGAISLIAQFSNSAEAQSGSDRPVQRTVSRNQSISQTPLLQRPNRPGHFIGNTIRNNYHRRSR